MSKSEAKRIKEQKKPTTAYVSFLLDESGSMTGETQRVIDGVNKYVEGLRNELPDARIAVRLFNGHKYRTHYDGKIDRFREMTEADYHPDAATPLCDAVFKSVAETQRQAGKKEKVFFIIDTDGFENCSKEVTQRQVGELIKKKTDAGWTFVFFGADLNAWEAASKMNLPAGIMNTRSVSKGDRVGAYIGTVSATVSSVRHDISPMAFWEDADKESAV